MDSVIDGMLERFEKTGPEFGPGLSNHGPMAAEALISLGRSDAVAGWCAWYAPRLGERPESRNAIDPAAWREALGHVGRVGDWSAFFRREVRERPWTDALEAWAARLAPGIMAGATHGVIRTAHAVRSLDAGVTRPRLDELADALAYWAARYQELPSRAAPAGALRPHEALPSVPRLDQRPRGGLIFEAVHALDAERFGAVIHAVSTDGEPGAFIRDLTRTFVRHYLANAAQASIPFIHTVTAPRALRLLAPHLSDATVRSAMRYAWQACASLYATYGGVDAASLPDEPQTAGADAADLVERAVAARDEHAIKFTEACLREHELTGDAAFLLAAQDAVARLARPA